MFSNKHAKRNKFISFEELLPRIIVKDPVIHETWDQGKFTTYLICIKTEHPAFHLQLSAVRHRFSELVWLDKVLKANHSHVHFPKLPPKKVFAERFDPDFIKSRMLEIQIYLNELLVTDTVLADAAFHFFIQTDLTTDEIEEYLNGTLPESLVKEAWDNAGHLHSSSLIVNSTTIPHEPKEIVMNEEEYQHHHRTSHSLDASYSCSSLENSVSNPETSDVFLNNPAPKTTSGGTISTSASDKDINFTNQDAPSAISYDVVTNLTNQDTPSGTSPNTLTDLTNQVSTAALNYDEVSNSTNEIDVSNVTNQNAPASTSHVEISNLTAQDKKVSSYNDSMTNNSDFDVSEHSSDSSDILDDNEVITQAGSDVMRLTLPVKNV